jgi:hypothetical protein
MSNSPDVAFGQDLSEIKNNARARSESNSESNKKIWCVILSTFEGEKTTDTQKVY